MDFQTDCEKKHRIKNSACIPKDLDLPFFTYGFFKPHQIAHSQIKRYSFKQCGLAFVKGHIRHVNGMPVLFLNRKSNYDVLGYIVNFKNRYKRRAYEKIGYSKHMRIYKWKEITVLDENGEQNLVNALVSSTPRKLSRSDVWQSMQNDMEFILRGDPHHSKVHDYDWKMDPRYRETIWYIEDSLRGFELYSTSYDDLIKIQMLYTSLWTSLDRFLTFKYGDTKKRNVIALSKEDYFEKILEDVLSWRIDFPTVFSAEDLDYHTLDKNDTAESALYYYTIRNNVVHTGKFVSEIGMLYDALVDLLEIFKRVLTIVAKE